LIEHGYGADSIRIMELFIGPWNQVANWSVEGMGGAFRFLQRVWTLVQEYNESDGGTSESVEIQRLMHKTIKKVSQDFVDLGFNTAVSTLMECVNQLYLIKAKDKYGATEWQWSLETLLQLLAPFAPHITEELWHQMGQESSIHTSSWPAYDEALTLDDTLIMVIQINGKLKGKIIVPRDIAEADAVDLAKKHPKIADYMIGKNIVKTIFIPNKLINFVAVG
jgi:leucyl-tRNA synthetase